MACLVGIRRGVLIEILIEIIQPVKIYRDERSVRDPLQAAFAEKSEFNPRVIQKIEAGCGNISVTTLVQMHPVVRMFENLVIESEAKR